MINISEKSFETMKKKEEVFSVISEYGADEITPIMLFNGLKGNKRFILESASTENYFGRYSYLGENPYEEIQGNSKENIDDIRSLINVSFDKTTNPFSFKGGAIGYLSYEVSQFYENKLNFNNEDELNIPTIRFNFYSRYICYDHFTHKVYVIDNILKNDNRSYFEIVESQKIYINSLISKPILGLTESKYKEIDYSQNISKDEFIQNVKKAKEEILNGNIFQVVLSQRSIYYTEKSAIDIYRNLRQKNPSPYMFLIDYDEYQVIGSSPESLVALKDKKVITNPIAGTRKRGETFEEDDLLQKELLKDEKEIAEHVMLVDLGRNDIGKVSQIGSVNVTSFMKVEKFSHVMHITSKVEGIILENKDAFDAVASCLPAGTVSGAPKIKSMEIIEKLENTKRSIYSGAVGYFSYGGNMDMAIAIRTLVLKNKRAYLQAGAGIVYDSVPEKEYDEIQNKLRVLKEVLK